MPKPSEQLSVEQRRRAAVGTEPPGGSRRPAPAPADAVTEPGSPPRHIRRRRRAPAAPRRPARWSAPTPRHGGWSAARISATWSAPSVGQQVGQREALVQPDHPVNALAHGMLVRRVPAVPMNGDDDQHVARTQLKAAPSRPIHRSSIPSCRTSGRTSGSTARHNAMVRPSCWVRTGAFKVSPNPSAVAAWSNRRTSCACLRTCCRHSSTRLGQPRRRTELASGADSWPPRAPPIVRNAHPSASTSSSRVVRCWPGASRSVPSRSIRCSLLVEVGADTAGLPKGPREVTVHLDGR